MSCATENSSLYPHNGEQKTAVCILTMGNRKQQFVSSQWGTGNSSLYPHNGEQKTAVCILTMGNRKSKQ
jgi:hypothetical protein